MKDLAFAGMILDFRSQHLRKAKMLDTLPQKSASERALKGARQDTISLEISIESKRLLLHRLAHTRQRIVCNSFLKEVVLPL